MAQCIVMPNVDTFSTTAFQLQEKLDAICESADLLASTLLKSTKVLSQAKPLARHRLAICALRDLEDVMLGLTREACGALVFLKSEIARLANDV